MRRGPCARGGQGTRRATSRAGKPPSLARSVQSDVIRLSSDSLCSSLPPLKPGCGTVYLHQYAFSAYNSFCSCAYCRPVHIDAAATALELDLPGSRARTSVTCGHTVPATATDAPQIYGRLGITSLDTETRTLATAQAFTMPSASKIFHGATAEKGPTLDDVAQLIKDGKGPARATQLGLASDDTAHVSLCTSRRPSSRLQPSASSSSSERVSPPVRCREKRFQDGTGHSCVLPHSGVQHPHSRPTS